MQTRNKRRFLLDFLFRHSQLDRIECKLDKILTMEVMQMASDTALLDAVTRVEGLSDSIIVLFKTCAMDAGIPQAQIDAVTTRIAAIGDKIDAAVAAPAPVPTV